jgi:hypothetical protein
MSTKAMSSPLRRVRYAWQQETWDAWFHGWTVVNGERQAVLERDNGEITCERGIHALRFLDTAPAVAIDLPEHPNYRYGAGV